MRDLVTEAATDGPQSHHALSFAQQRLWFIDRLEGGSSQYNISMAIRLQGQLDETKLRRALELIVERHVVLRTVFEQRGDEVVGRILPPTPLVFRTATLAVDPGEALPHALRVLIDEEVHRPFDLARDLMLRVMLVQLDGAEDAGHVLLIIVHHIAFDGWSFRIFVQELLASYAALVQGAAPMLPQLTMQYADYARWQKQRLQGALRERQAEYWRRQLEGIPQVHALPLDRKRPARQDAQGAVYMQRLDGDVAERVRALARSCRVTPFIVLQSVFAVLLHLRSGQDDIVMGSPIAGRTHEEIEPLIGLFINTLVLRTRLRHDMRFDELLQQNRDMALDAYENQDLPFEMLLDDIKPERSLSYTPVFQILFSLQNARPATAALPGLRVTEMESLLRKAKCDLDLAIEESGSRLSLRWLYASSLFEPGTMARMAEHFALLLGRVLADPGCRLDALPLLTANEQAMLVAWNDTAQEFPADSTICGMVVAQAGRTPHAVALRTDDRALSYSELDHLVSQLAHCLAREHGVGKGKVVALAVERSVEMVVGALAVMKAGGAYMPLDATHPRERLANMIGDSGATLVLTQPQTRERLDGLPATLLDIHDPASFAHYPDTGPEGRCHADSLAYVIYTSGSTGRPKGTLNLHRGVCNRLHTMQHLFGLTPADRVLQKTPLTFDPSVWELFWPLCNGATLVLARPEGHKNPDYLAESVRRHGITVINFVPSMLQVFLDSAPAGLTTLRYLMTVGEALSAELQAQCIAALPGTRLINQYGPTECAIEVSWCPFDVIRADRKVPIGRPVANTQLHILDRHNRPVPVGAVGELHIGGVQVGEGYLNEPELTAQKFVVRDIFGSPQRLYRTGDLARWLEDGNIEYLGRNDFQVKLRGLRIELGEIEAALAALPQVRAALVLALGEGAATRLAAYLLPLQGQAQVEDGALREALLRTLPDFMVPAHFVWLEQWPLTSNGKVDRKALPVPDVSAAAGYEAPQGALEMTVAALWQELLGLERVGRRDNFFDLGGHSLLAVRLVARLQRRIGAEVPLRLLFAQPELAAYAAALETARCAPRHDNLVAVRPGSGQPLFLIHPGEGEIAYAHNLAPRIGGDVPVYGIAAVGFLEGEVPLDSVVGMATSYRLAIQSVQPVGPYRLAGWSAGGTIACEIARQLHAAGERVSFLGAIDTPTSYAGLVPDEAAADPVQAQCAALLGWVAAELPDSVAASMEQMKQQGDLTGMLRCCQEVGLLAADIDTALLRRHVAVRFSIMSALQGHVTQAPVVPLHLFSADAAGRPDPTLGWSVLAGGQLRHIPIGGSHFSIVEPPHVEALGQAIASALRG